MWGQMTQSQRNREQRQNRENWWRNSIRDSEAVSLTTRFLCSRPPSPDSDKITIVDTVTGRSTDAFLNVYSAVRRTLNDLFGYEETTPPFVENTQVWSGSFTINVNHGISTFPSNLDDKQRDMLVHALKISANIYGTATRYFSVRFTASRYDVNTALITDRTTGRTSKVENTRCKYVICALRILFEPESIQYGVTPTGLIRLAPTRATRSAT